MLCENDSTALQETDSGKLYNMIRRDKYDVRMEVRMMPATTTITNKT